MIDMGCGGIFCLPIAIPTNECSEMKLKRLFLVLFFALQTIVSTAALAWSPLDGVVDAVERMHNCYVPVASSEEGGESSKNEGEEEEEPECD